MKLIHISDTHKTFPRLPKLAKEDIVVHSGDMFSEQECQEDWLRSNLNRFYSWLNPAKFVFSAGNHDRIDPISLLQSIGLEAYNITNQHLILNGIHFYGFPFIKYINGEWNYEKDSYQMFEEVEKLKIELNKGIQVLVAHAPPDGILDQDIAGNHHGNPSLANLLLYHDGILPKYILAGHLHPSYGFAEVCGVKISNAATTVNVINYDFS